MIDAYQSTYPLLLGRLGDPQRGRARSLGRLAWSERRLADHRSRDGSGLSLVKDLLLGRAVILRLFAEEALHSHRRDRDELGLWFWVKPPVFVPLPSGSRKGSAFRRISLFALFAEDEADFDFFKVLLAARLLLAPINTSSTRTYHSKQPSYLGLARAVRPVFFTGRRISSTSSPSKIISVSYTYATPNRTNHLMITYLPPMPFPSAFRVFASGLTPPPPPCGRAHFGFGL
ncbi:hypothetical protein CFAM422_009678 [Trichoderma lentiforme]|uniref:Uncharacterized protein n=1 Tax=Trichoderma lentiforme TaxID=1567552 RepID=A0A9P5CB52_9HYPO|nr:hypothetical protein CFAM422_009678 [Trichoderma lentiforme]